MELMILLSAIACIFCIAGMFSTLLELSDKKRDKCVKFCFRLFFIFLALAFIIPLFFIFPMLFVFLVAILLTILELFFIKKCFFSLKKLFEWGNK